MSNAQAIAPQQHLWLEHQANILHLLQWQFRCIYRYMPGKPKLGCRSRPTCQESNFGTRHHGHGQLPLSQIVARRILWPILSQIVNGFMILMLHTSQGNLQSTWKFLGTRTGIYHQSTWSQCHSCMPQESLHPRECSKWHGTTLIYSVLEH